MTTNNSSFLPKTTAVASAIIPILSISWFINERSWEAAIAICCSVPPLIAQIPAIRSRLSNQKADTIIASILLSSACCVILLFLFSGFSRVCYPNSVVQDAIKTELPFEGISDLVVNTRVAGEYFASTLTGDIYRKPRNSDNWEQVYNGENVIIGSLRIDEGNGSTIYALTDKGILRSTEAGSNWHFTNNGLPMETDGSLDTRSLTIRPNENREVLVSIWGKGIYKSSDGGSSWSAVNNGLTDLTVQTIAFHPLQKDLLFAGTSRNGIFISEDLGATWFQTNSTINNINVISIAFHPRSANLIYIGTIGTGVLYSNDSGKSWDKFPQRSENYERLSDQRIRSGPIFDQINPDIIYVGTYSRGLYVANAKENIWYNFPLSIAVVRVIRQLDNKVLVISEYGSFFLERSSNCQ